MRETPILLKLFQPLDAGGIRSSVFTLFSGTVGAGVLSLPAIFKYYGIIVGTMIIILSSVFARFSFMIFYEALDKSGKKTYPNCVAHFLGRVTNFSDIKKLEIRNFHDLLVGNHATMSDNNLRNNILVLCQRNHQIILFKHSCTP